MASTLQTYIHLVQSKPLLEVVATINDEVPQKLLHGKELFVDFAQIGGQVGAEKLQIKVLRFVVRIFVGLVQLGLEDFLKVLVRDQFIGAD